jgi:anti-sigma regulatory factor (Ser/Thr protein kinase)
MGEMTWFGAVRSTDLGWWWVSDAGTVGAVRRAAVALGQQVGLSERRLADLAIVAAELASNLHKHATDGAVQLRAVYAGTDAGVELVATDTGPGVPDLAVVTHDGYSTTGTLGIGLGAMARRSSEFEAFSQPGRGTTVAVAVWEGPTAPARWAAGLVRPMTGQTVCGDGYAVRVCGDRSQALLCDGLGHGPLAEAASQATVSAFHDAPSGGPAEVLAHVHRAVSHTRGVVAAVVDIDRGAGVVSCASVGNIAGWVVDPGHRRGMAAQPGIVGDRASRKIRGYDYPLSPDAVVVLHTDGVTNRWDLAAYPGLLQRGPLLIAATVLRDAGTRRDDAGVLVVKP